MPQIGEVSTSAGENKKHVHIIWSNVGMKNASSGNEIFDSTLESLTTY